MHSNAHLLSRLGLAGLRPAVLVPPACFQMGSAMPRWRKTPARSLPALSMRTPSPSLRTTCPAAWRCRFTIVILPSLGLDSHRRRTAIRRPRLAVPERPFSRSIVSGGSRHRNAPELGGYLRTGRGQTPVTGRDPFSSLGAQISLIRSGKVLGRRPSASCGRGRPKGLGAIIELAPHWQAGE